MVAGDQCGWDLALWHSQAADDAAQLAELVLSGDTCLLRALPRLHELLRELGEYEHGDFTGEFAPLSYMLLEVEPYLPGAASGDEMAARWLPTVEACHRPVALECCRRIVARYGAARLRRTS